MSEEYVSRASVITVGIWAVAVTLLVAVWVLATLHFAPQWVTSVAITSVFTTGVAITCQIRLYLARLCALIRIGTGLESPNAEMYNIKSQGPR